MSDHPVWACQRCGCGLTNHGPGCSMCDCKEAVVLKQGVTLDLRAARLRGLA